MTGSVLKVATYNIHRCFGTDAKYDPNRTVGVLEELDADIIALQEIDSHHVNEEGHQLNYIIKNTSYVHKTALSRAASDHLPVVAEVKLH